jgi:hypothetical protein
MLPERQPAAEDLFVAAYRQPDADTDALVEAIGAAMDARRPLLAARLVTLLDDHITIEPGSDLDRARRAAHFVVLNKPSPGDRSWSALEDAWRVAREVRMQRIKRRMRLRMSGKQERVGKGGRSRRR